MTPQVRKTSAAVLMATALIAGHEGLRNYAYLDPVKIWTVCYGETRGVKKGDYFTTEQCKEMLGGRIAEFEAGVDSCVKRDMPVTRKVAFISLAYNIGIAAFCKSTAARMMNLGLVREACNAITLWDKAKGIRLPGLVRRRAEERELCLQ